MPIAVMTHPSDPAAASPALNAARWSGPRLLLHIEGLALFAAACIAYAALHGPGGLFALLFFAPDLTFIAFFAGPRIGAWVYNAAHHPLLPGLLMGAAFAAGWEPGVLVGLIWVAHIFFDRVFGYGYKYATAFKDTHMQRV